MGLWTAALLLAAAPLAARTADWPGRWGLGLGSSVNNHAMGDVNAGKNAEIHTGIGAALDLKWHALRHLSTGLELEFMVPQLRETTYSSLPGYRYLENYSATAVSLGAWYAFTPGPLELRLGGAFGVTSLSGAFLLSESPSTSTTRNLTGSAANFKLGGGLDWFLGRHWSLNLDLGWRYCNVWPVSADGKELKKSNGEALSVDYGGVYSKAGFSVWF